ncbi:phosphotransferase family protein [Nocardiopsis coralliicola]
MPPRRPGQRLRTPILIQETTIGIEQIRHLVEDHTGPLAEVAPISGGHSGATTAIVTGYDGERTFIKSVPHRAGGHLDSVVREGQINPAVAGIAPRLRWTAVDDEWFVLGYEAIHGRKADFAPGSSDLPLVVAALDAIAATPVPAAAAAWTETRWDAVTDAPELLRGATLTYTDIQPENVLVDDVDGWCWVIDWEWPTVGSPAIGPTCLAVQLVSSGHTPASAEAWIAGTDVWARADAEAADAIARADARLRGHLADAYPDVYWLGAMAEAARAWAAHRGVIAPTS